MNRVIAKTVATASVLIITSTAGFASEAFLEYSRPPVNIDNPAYLSQVTNYPAFRPVERTSAAQQPGSEMQSGSPSTGESSESENITINVDGRVQVVPRSSINRN